MLLIIILFSNFSSLFTTANVVVLMNAINMPRSKLESPWPRLLNATSWLFHLQTPHIRTNIITSQARSRSPHWFLFSKSTPWHFSLSSGNEKGSLCHFWHGFKALKVMHFDFYGLKKRLEVEPNNFSKTLLICLFFFKLDKNLNFFTENFSMKICFQRLVYEKIGLRKRFSSKTSHFSDKRCKSFFHLPLLLPTDFFSKNLINFQWILNFFSRFSFSS